MHGTRAFDSVKTKEHNITLYQEQCTADERVSTTR